MSGFCKLGIEDKHLGLRPFRYNHRTSWPSDSRDDNAGAGSLWGHRLVIDNIR